MPLIAGLAEILRKHPELAIFLTLAIGFQLGKLRLGTFTLGNVLGCLLAGVAVGQVGIAVDPTVKVVFFDLFLFGTGYKVGPQFFRGLRRDALPQLALAVLVAVTCLATAVLVSRFMGYDAGTAAGLLAGAFTESTIIGTASEAIMRLPLGEAERVRMANRVPVAYAVTYLVGTTTLVWYLSSLAPRLMRIDLRKEARALEVKLTGREERAPGVESAYGEWETRAYRAGPGASGRRVRELESTAPERRVFVERLRRGSVIGDPGREAAVQEGDVLAVTARRPVHVEGFPWAAAEVDDRDLLDFPIVNVDLVVTQKEIAGRTLGDLAREKGHGIVLQRLVRAGQEIPFDAGTRLERGDMLSLYGDQPDVERLAREIGHASRHTPDTDMVFVGLGIFLGGLLGLVAVNVAGISVTLTTSGGALVLGLVMGWLRSTRPTFGRIPEPALWIFDTVGLAAFIGIVGLNAGPQFVSGVRETGLGLVGAGLVVTLLPHTIGLLFGRLVLKMNPVILLGAESGSGTTTAALRAVQDAAGSKLPVLGYTVPYAIGNILLTAWGPVIVALMR
ncbi:MAG: aspartate-alanine antiporter [Anaeromyxobacteraceae bacterium]